MPFDPNTLHLFSLAAIAILVINIFLLGAVLLFGGILFRRLFAYHEEIDRHERNTLESARKILHEAETNAALIVRDAHKKANDLLGQAESLKRKSEEEFAAALQLFSKLHGEELSRATQSFSGHLDSLLGEVKAKISEDTKKSISLFEHHVEAEMDTFRAGLQDAAGRSHDAAEAHMARYRTEAMKEVDEKLFKIISDISREAIGRALELEDHRDLLGRLLDRAKRDFLKK